MFTSLKFSKRLKDNGCELLSDYWHFMAYPGSLVLPGPSWIIVNTSELLNYKEEDYLSERAYDIIYDICVRYGKEFFGEDETGYGKKFYDLHTHNIIEKIRQNKPQSEIEDYIWENCKFNPNNK